MKYKYIIFDLDGTLLDTSEGLIKSINYTLDVPVRDDIYEYMTS